MGFRKNVLEKLDVIEKSVRELAKIVMADERLVKQNQDLFDRLMSIKWEDYAMRSPELFNRMGEEVKRPNSSDLLVDENLIGEIISDEELGK